MWKTEDVSKVRASLIEGEILKLKVWIERFERSALPDFGMLLSNGVHGSRCRMGFWDVAREPHLVWPVLLAGLGSITN